MSTDTHSSPAAGFHCEAVTTDTIASPCVHGRLANTPRLEAADLGCGPNQPDDPAVLIGLTLAFVRQGPLLDGHVPELLMLRLRALADGGNAACHLLLDWLRNRNRDLGWLRNEHLTRLAPLTPPGDTPPLRRSPRERVLATIAKPGHRDRRKLLQTRPRDPARNPETAIIAAETGGRTDG
ncbi:hypothetical protein [Rhizobium leguminosarum]